MIKTKNGTVAMKGKSNAVYAADIIAILCAYATFEAEGLGSWAQAADNLAYILYHAIDASKEYPNEVDADVSFILRRGVEQAAKWLKEGLPDERNTEQSTN